MVPKISGVNYERREYMTEKLEISLTSIRKPAIIAFG